MGLVTSVPCLCSVFRGYHLHDLPLSEYEYQVSSGVFLGFFLGPREAVEVVNISFVVIFVVVHFVRSFCFRVTFHLWFLGGASFYLQGSVTDSRDVGFAPRGGTDRDPVAAYGSIATS